MEVLKDASELAEILNIDPLTLEWDGEEYHADGVSADEMQAAYEQAVAAEAEAAQREEREQQIRQINAETLAEICALTNPLTGLPVADPPDLQKALIAQANLTNALAVTQDGDLRESIQNVLGTVLEIWQAGRERKAAIQGGE